MSIEDYYCNSCKAKFRIKPNTCPKCGSDDIWTNEYLGIVLVEKR